MFTTCLFWTITSLVRYCPGHWNKSRKYTRTGCPSVKVFKWHWLTFRFLGTCPFPNILSAVQAYITNTRSDIGKIFRIKSRICLKALFRTFINASNPLTKSMDNLVNQIVRALKISSSPNTFLILFIESGIIFG